MKEKQRDRPIPRTRPPTRCRHMNRYAVLYEDRIEDICRDCGKLLKMEDLDVFIDRIESEKNKEKER